MLDTVRGAGAAGMRVELRRGGEVVRELALDSTGRGNMADELNAGGYELLFHAGEYQGANFFDIIPIRFYVNDPAEHYHIPLILSPFGYSTYRGG